MFWHTQDKNCKSMIFGMFYIQTGHKYQNTAQIMAEHIALKLSLSITRNHQVQTKHQFGIILTKFKEWKELFARTCPVHRTLIFNKILYSRHRVGLHWWGRQGKFKASCQKTLPPNRAIHLWDAPALPPTPPQRCTQMFTRSPTCRSTNVNLKHTGRKDSNDSYF